MSVSQAAVLTFDHCRPCWGGMRQRKHDGQGFRFAPVATTVFSAAGRAMTERRPCLPGLGFGRWPRESPVWLRGKTRADSIQRRCVSMVGERAVGSCSTWNT